MTEAPGPRHPVEPGLCGTCANARVIVSDRGSTFLLCRLSARDPRFPRYPRLPVAACRGWVAADPPPPAARD